MIDSPPDPIVEGALVTPIDTRHKWHTHVCRVSRVIDDQYVMIHAHKATSHHVRFEKMQLAVLENHSASAIAMAIGRHIGRLKHR